MIYSVFNFILLLIWGCNLVINKASLILRLPTWRTIASILMEKLSSLFFHSFKCLWNEDARVLRCSLLLHRIYRRYTHVDIIQRRSHRHIWEASKHRHIQLKNLALWNASKAKETLSMLKIILPSVASSRLYLLHIRKKSTNRTEISFLFSGNGSTT